MALAWLAILKTLAGSILKQPLNFGLHWHAQRVTGETTMLAVGPVRLTVNYAYGRLGAADSGKQALQPALVQWTAAQVSSLSHAEQHWFPSDADLARVMAMAAKLIEAGKRRRRMPRFVAPLSLEACVRQDGDQTHPTNASELSSAVESGESLILFGQGGIGKTTFLLDLSVSCTNGSRIPLYEDAAPWGR